jgi:hypothetical protein
MAISPEREDSPEREGDIEVLLEIFEGSPPRI